MKALPGPKDDPDAIRMTIGEHLDELRRVLMRSLLALFGACLICIWPTKFLLEIITRPLILAMKSEGQPTTFLATHPTEAILVYIKVVVIFALIIAGPYVLYQVWGFVAAGLYRHEKNWVYKLLPASVGLFLGGVCFMYFFVLLVCLKFLIGFASWLPAPSTDFVFPWETYIVGEHRPAAETQPSSAPAPLAAPILEADPAQPEPGQIWFNRHENRLKVQGSRPDERWAIELPRDTRRGLITPHFKLDEYLSFVLVMTIAFGAAFQLPLVVIFLVRAGIMTAEQLGRSRRIVILVIVIIAGVLAPPDLTSHLLLSLPMLLLFEIGLLIARRKPKEARPA
ncbi:MAG: preprotein translocase subunit TatC [Phycisphaerales bacterium]|nr:preprotein translocase subunit TatC [Phycisphaerales bacterium]